MAIDGKEVGADVNGAIEHMRGVSGSTVTLTIQRAGKAGLLKFALRRANVEVHSVCTRAWRQASAMCGSTIQRYHAR